MKRTLATAAIVLVGSAGLLAGCGDSTPAADTTATATSSSTTGQADATATVTSAFATLRGQPYTSTGVTEQQFDMSALPTELQDALRAQLDATGATVKTTTRFESAQRIETTQEIGGRTQYVVLYDGSVYVSPDGTTWAKATGDAAAAFSRAASLSELNPASLFTGITADGTGTVSGSSAQKFTAGIDTATTGDAVAAVTSSLGALGSAIGDALTIDSGSAVLMVDDSTGAISQMTITMQIGLDIGAIATAAGADSASEAVLRITSTGTETVTAVGGAITIERPATTRTVSSVTELGTFLAS